MQGDKPQNYPFNNCSTGVLASNEHFRRHGHLQDRGLIGQGHIQHFLKMHFWVEAYQLFLLNAIPLFLG